MRVLPILFNTDMVRAILEGRKTVTRRVVKSQPVWITQDEKYRACPSGWWWGNDRIKAVEDKHLLEQMLIQEASPYRPGDILYVRETFAGDGYGENGDRYVYGADVDDCGRLVWGDINKGEWAPASDYHWRPSIHMPREAARIFLRVTDVRVERLQDITVDGINSEGVDVEPPPICRKGDPTESERAAFAKLTVQKQDEYISTLARHTYMGWCKYADDLFVAWENLWNSTIKPADRDRYGWAANPWVFRVEFERCEKPEGFAT